MFSTRHYEWLARFCGCTVEDHHLWLALADALGRDNPRFNHDKFLDACRRAETLDRNTKTLRSLI